MNMFFFPSVRFHPQAHMEGGEHSSLPDVMAPSIVTATKWRPVTSLEIIRIHYSMHTYVEIYVHHLYSIHT